MGREPPAPSHLALKAPGAVSQTVTGGERGFSAIAPPVNTSLTRQTPASRHNRTAQVPLHRNLDYNTHALEGSSSIGHRVGEGPTASGRTCEIPVREVQGDCHRGDAHLSRLKSGVGRHRHSSSWGRVRAQQGFASLQPPPPAALEKTCRDETKPWRSAVQARCKAWVPKHADAVSDPKGWSDRHHRHRYFDARSPMQQAHAPPGPRESWQPTAVDRNDPSRIGPSASRRVRPLHGMS